MSGSGYYSLYHLQCEAQCGKFVSRGGEIPRALLMLSIYLLLNFRNLPRAISKLSSLVRSHMCFAVFHGWTDKVQIGLTLTAT